MAPTQMLGCAACMQMYGSVGALIVWACRHIPRHPDARRSCVTVWACQHCGCRYTKCEGTHLPKCPDARRACAAVRWSVMHTQRARPAPPTALKGSGSARTAMPVRCSVVPARHVVCRCCRYVFACGVACGYFPGTWFAGVACMCCMHASMWGCCHAAVCMAPRACAPWLHQR